MKILYSMSYDEAKLYINLDKACIKSMISVAFSQLKCLVVDMEI